MDKASGLTMTISMIDTDEFKDLLFIARDIVGDPDVPEKHKEAFREYVNRFEKKHGKTMQAPHEYAG